MLNWELSKIFLFWTIYAINLHKLFVRYLGHTRAVCWWRMTFLSGSSSGYVRSGFKKRLHKHKCILNAFGLKTPFNVHLKSIFQKTHETTTLLRKLQQVLLRKPLLTIYRSPEETFVGKCLQNYYSKRLSTSKPTGTLFIRKWNFSNLVLH